MSFFRASSDFSPLFRLLDDFDTHRSSYRQASVRRSFTPKFDVRESKGAYHLDGELPGIAQKDVDIEFTTPETLVIKGRVEREYNTTPENQTLHARVEDEPADESSSRTEVAKTGDKQVSKNGNEHRFWVSERSIGEFHRTFTFPDHIDQEHVKASLKNGILSVIIPKASAPTAKKIRIE
ncbi:hypothetical protein BBP40_005617 [Aspergillus hancockii]|nr:hypothetical protein BBP40_005617 [Aspergillus hancockii]